jgi:hypothetical protein
MSRGDREFRGVLTSMCQGRSIATRIGPPGTNGRQAVRSGCQPPIIGSMGEVGYQPGYHCVVVESTTPADGLGVKTRVNTSAKGVREAHCPRLMRDDQTPWQREAFTSVGTWDLSAQYAASIIAGVSMRVHPWLE